MSRASDYPVCLRLDGADVVVVGGGEVALSRVRGLLEVGARITLVAPSIKPELRALPITLVERGAEEGDVCSCSFCFVCSDDPELSARIAAACRRQRVLVNTADVPELCDFTLPSVGRRGAVTVAVSTSGQAPALARLLKNELVARVSRRHAHLARLIGVLRTRLPAGPDRMQLLKSLVEGDAGALLLKGQRRSAFTAVRKAIQR